MADTEKRQKLGSFLTRKYEEYRQSFLDRGRPAPTRGDFAIKFLGIDEQNFSQWSNAKRLIREYSDIEKLADKLGDEVYEILGITPRMPKSKRLKTIVKKLAKLSDAQQDEIDERVTNMLSDNEQPKLVS